MVNLRGKRVLVTGGAGLIGSFLVKALLERGALIRVADFVQQDRSRSLARCIKDIEYLQGDLRMKDFSNRAIKDIDIVYHLAARIGNALNTKTFELDMGLNNIEIDMSVLGAIRRERVPYFLYASTAGVYNGSRSIKFPTPEDEAWKGQPSSLYGSAKLIGEHECFLISEEIKSQVVAARLFSVYGEGEDHGQGGRVIPHLIRKILLKEPYVLWGNGSQIRTFLHATDAAAVLTLLIENAEKVGSTPVNVGHHTMVTTNELAHLVANLSPYPDKPSPIWDQTMPTGAYAMVPDLSRIKSILDWSPVVSLQEGLERMFQYYAKVYRIL